MVSPGRLQLIILDRHGATLAACWRRLRLPEPAGLRHRPPRDLYAEILDQVAWLDGLGLDLVWFTEHHFVDDGYLPSWTPVAGAMAARTQRVRFSSDICLLPFNHPIRLAEDLAVLDNLSGGRIELGVGHGLRAARVPRLRHPAVRSGCRGPRKGSRCCAAASPASASAFTASATTSTTSSSARATSSRAARRSGSPPCRRAAARRAARVRRATCCRRARASRCSTRGARR